MNKLRLLNDNVLVRVVKQPDKIGSIFVPDENSLRPPVVVVVDKGPGKITKTVYKDQWMPGSKQWKKVGHEVPLKGHGRDTEDIVIGSYYITSHPYVKSNPVVIDDEKLFIIQSYELICEIQFEDTDNEDTSEDKEKMLGRIEMTKITVSG